MSTIAEIAAKCAGIRKFQRDERGLIGRDHELHVVQVALISQQHVLLYGTPGVAKSMTVDGVLKHMPELTKFKTQAYKASPPEQFIGPISIKGMENDEFVRNVARRAPDVEVFVCDEIARAPRSLLPAFQGMMVEREFDAGRGVEPVPLKSLIGTCNHIPDDSELEAFFDRFPLKLVVEPPASQHQFAEIMRGALKRRSLGEPAIPDELIISAEELETITKFAANYVQVPDAVIDAYAELWSNLLGVGIQPSVRRFVDLTAAMQAIAALDGRDEVLIDDMQIAQDSLWTSLDEREQVFKETLQFASPWVKEKANLIDSFSDILERLGQVQALVSAGTDQSTQVDIDDVSKSITDHALKVVNEQKQLRPLIEHHIADAAGRDVAELNAVLAQMDAGAAWVSDRILGGLML